MHFKKCFRPFASILILTLILGMAAGLNYTQATAATAEDTVGLTYDEVMAKAIDPQSWQLQEDMLWNELKPNPVIDWMTELNPDGLVNPKASGNKDPIRGALLLVDYWDRPFITTQPLNTDLLGYYLYDEYGQFEDEITKNPIIHIDLEDYTQWIADYLNKNSDLNHYRSIDEFWRENSYGKWQIELDSFGPYHLKGFEFEYAFAFGSWFSWADQPPSFRRGASGTTGSRSLANESVALAWQNDVFLGDYDFFFILHAGYNESAVWYEFGQMQWAKPQDVPYEYGAGAKMEEVEAILTAHPEYLLELEKPNVLSFSSITPAINGYNQNATLRDALAEVKQRMADGTLDEFVFKFPQADWDWYDNYSWGNAAPTRYVPWTSWIAFTSAWASSASATVPRSPENGGGSRSVQYSQQGECDGMGTFAHEFGHIVSHTDNYEATMWTQNVSPKTDYWDLMSRADRNGPGGYHARWSVPGGQEACGCPGHFMMFPKRRSGYFDAGDLLELSVAQLKARTPLVTNVISRNVPLNNAGYYPQLDEYGLKAPNYYKGIMLEFDSANPDASTQLTTGYSNNRYRAGWTGIEVVDKSGYDSFANDHGVLISRLVSGNLSSAQNRWVIDSHLYDIGLVDYYLNGEPTYYCIGHADQLNDALFHAGQSSVDTGYYSGNYTVNNDGTYISDSGTKHGSMRQWEERDGRDIVSGDTVNEWYDTVNKLHFYILQKNLSPAKYGEFLSYQVGLLHDDGPPVGGGLALLKDRFEPASEGRYAVQHYRLKHIGAEATDIIRITFDGDLRDDAIVLNNLYALGVDESVEFAVYIKAPAGGLTEFPDDDLLVIVESETNAAKSIVSGIPVTFEKPANGKITLQNLAGVFEDVSGQTLEFVAGEEVSLNAVANTGYRFHSWSSIPAGLTGSAASTTFPFTFTEPASISAAFSRISNSSGHVPSNNSYVSPTKVTYDADKGKDLKINVTRNGNNLRGLKNGNTALKEGVDYTVNGSIVTFKADYLCGLKTGDHIISFEMSAGTVPKLTITVTRSVEDEDDLGFASGYKPMQPLHPAGAKVEAAKTNDTLIIDEVETEFSAVKINDYNWLKLRDFAKLLMGTSKKFSIFYDDATNIIDIRSNGTYQPLGDELEDALADMESAVSSPQRLRLDGQFIDVAAYNINGYNYLRLRDLAIILNFAVIYDDESGQITLDLDKPYDDN